ncbi:MAG TPA: DegT/DnrJ/EryC1/StrS family aminotransferase [Bacteroidia bacterium]|nr:DegT/DnrJ/EryC1/StrS family aminotransferase [Bacteroidia bacterium]
MINVTKTYLPPIEEYTRYLNKIWVTNQVTNNGPLVLELEEKLKKYLRVKHLFLTSNGTIALQIAIKALGLTKEIITTPFSYVATTTSVLWENCKPVFVDIDPATFCINPLLIEEKITPNTEAILATHVYGIPCAIEKIEEIARKNNLKVIYDAAHAFGTEYNNKSLASYGDISTLSFHATKLFHTIEGGAIITEDDSLARQIGLYRSFGHIYDDYFSIGINGKNSEFHAAMGLCLLNKVPEFIEKRKEITKSYDALLSDLKLAKPIAQGNTLYNYSYYAVAFKSEEDLLRVKNELGKSDIFPRRYFYPSLNELPYLERTTCKISENYSRRVLCLPSYHELQQDTIELVASIINNTLKN